MTEFELHHTLDLLADEAEPAPVDVYDVIARAKARTRDRRATMATSLAVVTVAGAMIATIGLNDSSPRHVGGSPPSRTSTTTSSSSVPKPIFDGKSRHFTQLLAQAWPTIAPTGVTVKASSLSSSDLSALEFGGSAGMVGSELLVYDARATLSDAKGSTELSIRVWPPGEQVMGFAPCVPSSTSCEYRQLDDGTQVNLGTDPNPSATASASASATTMTDVLRPDGTRIWIEENNTDQTIDQALTRPTTFFTAEELIPFGMLFTY